MHNERLAKINSNKIVVIVTGIMWWTENLFSNFNISAFTLLMKSKDFVELFFIVEKTYELSIHLVDFI